MNIGSIVWPTSTKDACNHYLVFALQVIDELGIVFDGPAPDPVVATKRYVNGDMSEDDYRATRALWWRSVDEAGTLRNFQDQTALTARLAICLLSATPDEAPRLGDHLSWFLEVIGMGCDLDPAIRRMTAHFEFRK